MILAQISDLHVTDKRQLVCGRIDTNEFAQRCVRRMLSLATVPDAVIVTGDLVERGTTSEYQVLKELLAPLAMPVYLMAGNHDDRATLRSVFPSAPVVEMMNDYLQYAFDVGPLRVIALDSIVPGKSGGRLCSERLHWLQSQLESATDKPVVIALHHPPFRTGIAAMDNCSLDGDDAKKLATIVSQHNNVERIICGHLHRSISVRFAGTIAMTAPSCAHQVDLDFDPAKPLGYNFEPPAFMQHVWINNSLVSHHTYVDVAEGPYLFA
jgi:3',5'-cyclic-AMP phosphodiesterase